jgi:hypothetical protein
MINIYTAKNDYLRDGELLTQMSSFTLMFAAFGLLISPIF